MGRSTCDNDAALGFWMRQWRKAAVSGYPCNIPRICMTLQASCDDIIMLDYKRLSFPTLMKWAMNCCFQWVCIFRASNDIVRNKLLSGFSWITIFWSFMKRFAKDFHPWMCHSRKSLATLQWRHNRHVVISNHHPHDCLLNHSFRCRSKKTSKHHVTALCEGNSLVTSEFPIQRASDMENVSNSCHHHELPYSWPQKNHHSCQGIVDIFTQQRITHTISIILALLLKKIKMYRENLVTHDWKYVESTPSHVIPAIRNPSSESDGRMGHGCVRLYWC